MNQVTPKAAALAAVTILRERLESLDALLRGKPDDAAKVPIGLCNEYQWSVEKTDDGLAVACWSTWQEYDGTEPPPVTAGDAYYLARKILDGIAMDASSEVALCLCDYVNHKGVAK